MVKIREALNSPPPPLPSFTITTYRPGDPIIKSVYTLHKTTSPPYVRVEYYRLLSFKYDRGYEFHESHDLTKKDYKSHVRMTSVIDRNRF